MGKVRGMAERLLLGIGLTVLAFVAEAIINRAFKGEGTDSSSGQL
jgi:hypothetical protein